MKTAQRLIGLTGGIATGKTTVANYLGKKYNLPILDADIYAREAVETGTPIFQEIIQRYGNRVLLEDGSLNRQHLGEIIFGNAQERKWLESQIHPYVRDLLWRSCQKQVRVLSSLNTLTSETIVLVIPLLFEAKMTDLVTEIWVVTCREDQQLQRLIERNNLSIEQAQNRISSQMPLSQKVAAADFVLDNSSTVESLLQQVDATISKSPM